MTSNAHLGFLPVARTAGAGSTAASGALLGAAGSRSPEAMLSRRYLARLRLTDAAVIAVAMGATLLLRVAALGAGDRRSTPALEAGICLAVALAWYTALSLTGCRDRRRLGAGAEEYRHLLTATVVTFGALGLAGVVLDVHLGRAYGLAALPLGIAGLVLTRWAWRNWLVAQGREEHFLSRAVIVGARDDVSFVLRQIRAAAGASFHVVGAAVAELGDPYLRIDGERVPVIGGLASVAEAARTVEADTVIVASQPHDGGEYVRSLSWSLEGSGAGLVLASRLVDVAGPRIRFSPVQGLPLIHVDIPEFDGAKHALKRAFDIVAAAAALLLLAPLFAVLGALIAREDGGAVFFRQERVGRDGSLFRMVKFRSMVPDAEARLAELRAASDDGNGVLFKLKDDPRVTRVGRMLRKFSLDELPQFWNVLLGDMSLVGPRPPLPSEVREYDSPARRRLYIKPGLTGMWQVSGRSELSWAESIRLDLYYVENWSLAGDLVILWRTLRVLLKPVGAY